MRAPRSLTRSAQAHVVVDRTRLVQLVGELDMSGRADVTRACCEGIGVEVRVDLAGVTFMDCAGYRGLVDARAELEGRGGSLTLAYAVDEPARLLALLDADVMPDLTVG